MATQATIRNIVESEELEQSTTLAIELDDIPGAVWQAELQALMPEDIRATLFERGGQKFALLKFPDDQRDRARTAFEQALSGANEVSQQAHSAARAARDARERLKASGA